MNSFDPHRIMAWSLALIALVLAIFVPLSYLELRRQSRLPAPATAAVQSVSPAPAPVASVPSPPTAPAASETTRPLEPLSSDKRTQLDGKIRLGDWHLARGEFDEAISLYQEAEKIGPGSIEIRQKLDSAIAACKKERAILGEDLKCSEH